jgi:hypothetical protein
MFSSEDQTPKEKWIIPGLGQEMPKMSLELPVVLMAQILSDQTSKFFVSQGEEYIIGHVG